MSTDRRRSLLLSLALGYTIFVVYGSLVPLNFNPRPLDDVWRDFLAVPYLVLGVGNRADWIANILLYMPLSFLIYGGFAGPRSQATQMLRAGAVFLACTTLAFGVEFTQMFFPPRTVSINDLVAEVIGSALGIAIWHLWGSTLERLWTEMRYGGPKAIRAAAIIYVLAYLALSLFPYDFYVSVQEFSHKFSSDSFGTLLAPATCGTLLNCVGKLIAESLVAVPLGVLFGQTFTGRTRNIHVAAVILGLILGAAIESLQLLMHSGVSQGISVLTRPSGILLGVLLGRYACWQWLFTMRQYLGSAVLLAVVPYLLVAMWANGWFAAGWAGWAYASNSLEQVHWLPFYYHYFTTETVAVVSAAMTMVIYLPVGMGSWLWRFSRAHTDKSAMMPVLIAAALAVVMEIGKLFVPGRHPDPTSVPLGAAAAAMGYLFMQFIYKWSTGTTVVPMPVAATRVELQTPSARKPQEDADGVAKLSRLRICASLLLFAVVAATIAIHPLGPIIIGTPIAICMLVVWLVPGAAVPLLLTALPVAGLAPFTGWLFIEEFDILLLAILAVRLVLPHSPMFSTDVPDSPRWITGMVMTSAVASAAIGLFPLEPLDANAFANYYSHYNALRVFKGYAWGLVLLVLVRSDAMAGRDWRWFLAGGMLLGLTAVSLAALWERQIFSGLLNFSSDFRITATFFDMHTGGGSVEAYLAAAIPFSLLVAGTRGVALKLVAVGVFACATYAMAVTYARGGYVAYVVAFLIMCLPVLFRIFRTDHWFLRWTATVGVASTCIAIVVVMVLPIVGGSYMHARLAALKEDHQIRLKHWQNALNLIPNTFTATLFGVGLGTFPERSFWLNPLDQRPSAYRFQHEGNRSFVQLSSGLTIYFGQRISLRPHHDYRLIVEFRSAIPKASLTVPICAKSILYSYDCQWLVFGYKQEPGVWDRQEFVFNSGEFGSGAWYQRRPLELALYNNSAGALVDVAFVSLGGTGNNNLIKNADFSRGGEFWFISADDHLPWHIKNLPVQLRFEQGWMGVFTIATLLVFASWRLASALRHGDSVGGTVLASLAAFLVVGLVNSFLEIPRLAALLIFLLLLGAGWPRKRRPD